MVQLAIVYAVIDILKFNLLYNLLIIENWSKQVILSKEKISMSFDHMTRFEANDQKDFSTLF